MKGEEMPVNRFEQVFRNGTTTDVAHLLILIFGPWKWPHLFERVLLE